MKRFIFVGIRPSISARKWGKQWSDGAYAGKQLKDALDKLDLDFDQMTFVNLYTMPLEGADKSVDARDLKKTIREIVYWSQSFTVVGMGKEVQETLTNNGISHLKLVHPAARGLIRKKDRYLKHCRTILFQEEANV